MIIFRTLGSILCFNLITLAYGEIIELDDESYYELPKLFSLEDYESCLAKKSGVYCMATFHLTEHNNTKLYQILEDFSRNKAENFNHSVIHRAICLTKCKNYISMSDDQENRMFFEKCVHERTVEEYGLGAKLKEFNYCKKQGDVRNVDFWDWSFLIIISFILTLNCLGTVIDIVLKRKVSNWLTCFSIRANWNRLTSNIDPNNVDGNRNVFTSVHGVKTISMFLVIFSHVNLCNSMAYVNNPRMIEQFPRNPMTVLVYNGSLIMQTFFFLSGFLLAYNFLSFIEKQKKFDYKYMLHGITIRYIRLTPAYLTVLGFVSTWMYHIGDGPMWNIFVEKEREVCRNKFLVQLAYLHNWIKAEEMCLGQAWYLAADCQLFVFGLVMLMIVWSKRISATFILSASIVASTLAVFALALLWDLKPPVLLQTPENLRNLYKGNESWRLMVTSAIPNLPGYAVGMLVGVIFRNLEVNRYRVVESKWFTRIYWCSFPFGVCLIASGRAVSIFEHSPLVVSAYAALARPLFALVVAVIMVGNFQQIDSIYRRICDWSEWRLLSRLSYCALLVHTFALRVTWGLKMQDIQLTVPDVVIDWLGITVISYLLSIPLALMVELPFIELQKSFISRPIGNGDSNEKAAGKKM